MRPHPFCARWEWLVEQLQHIPHPEPDVFCKIASHAAQEPIRADDGRVLWSAHWDPDGRFVLEVNAHTYDTHGRLTGIVHFDSTGKPLRADLFDSGSRTSKPVVIPLYGPDAYLSTVNSSRNKRRRYPLLRKRRI